MAPRKLKGDGWLDEGMTPRASDDGMTMMIPSGRTWQEMNTDGVGQWLVGKSSFLWVNLLWSSTQKGGGRDAGAGRTVLATGTIYLSKEGWHSLCIDLARGREPGRLFSQAGHQTEVLAAAFVSQKQSQVGHTVKMGGWEEFALPCRLTRAWVPDFIGQLFGGLERVRDVAKIMDETAFRFAFLFLEFYRISLESGPYSGEAATEVLTVLEAVREEQVDVTDCVNWEIIRREVRCVPSYIDDVFRLFDTPWNC